MVRRKKKGVELGTSKKAPGGGTRCLNSWVIPLFELQGICAWGDDGPSRSRLSGGKENGFRKEWSHLDNLPMGEGQKPAAASYFE